MEQSGTLAPGASSGTRQNFSYRNISQARGYSLGCLSRGPGIWKWVFVMAVPLICVDRSTSGDHKVFRTQIRICRIWSGWKCNGLLSLVALALSGPEKALQWLLFQLLRYPSCGICGNELEGLALVAWGQKSPFPRWPNLHHLFCYTGMVSLRRDILVVVYPFMTHHFHCGQDCTEECAHERQMLPLAFFFLVP